jgi:O-antigen polymerase
MNILLSSKHRQAIFFSLTFITSFILSKQYTDPYFIPKDYFLFFSSALFVFVTCLVYYNRKFNTILSISWLDITIAGLVLFFFIQLFFSPGISVGNIKFLLFLISGILYFLIKPFLFEADKKDKSLAVATLVNVLLIIAILQACWGFLQDFGILPNMEKQFNIGGAFGNPGQYTNFLTPLLSFSLAVFLFSKKKNKTLGLLATLSIMAILPFTQARTSWIGAIFVFIYMVNKRYLLIGKCANFLKSAILKTAVIVVLVMMVILSGYYIYNLKKNSSSGRLFIWKVCTTMIQDNPFRGFGFDRFAAAHNDYQANYFKTHPNDKENAEVADGVNYAFNEFIQVTVETGIIGLALMILIFVFAFRAKKKEPGEEDLYFYAAKGSVIAIFISFLFSYPLHTVPSLLLLFLSLAIIDAKNEGKILFHVTILPKIRKTLSVLGVVMVIIFSVLQFQRNKAERNWQKAFQMMRNNQIEESYKLYREVYPTLTYNQFFLFNFGAELSLMKKYDESIEILKQAEPRINDSDFYIYLANSYENKDNMQAAEQCYLQSSYIMPLKFFPKYKLVGIYMSSNRKNLGLSLAKNIIDMPVKVQSQTIVDIKQEMAQLLKNNGGF